MDRKVIGVVLFVVVAVVTSPTATGCSVPYSSVMQCPCSCSCSVGVLVVVDVIVVVVWHSVD